MKKIPGVTKVAGGSFIPPFGNFLPLNLANPEGERTRFDGLIMGEGMTELLDIEVIDGSSFGPYKPTPLEVLINESSARKYNLKAGDNYLNAISYKRHCKRFSCSFAAYINSTNGNSSAESFKDESCRNQNDGTNDKAIISRLRELYNQISPDEIFEVRYLTDEIANFYRYEKNQAKIIGAFSFLATVLAIMGLFGIALISIARKTKEIGLRKVNGASVAEVMYLLNKGFVKWVLVSLIIGIPVSYYLMAGWQNRFAYKTDLSWWIFGLAGLLALGIALLTVSWQSWRAATRNPVEALRYE